MTEGSAVPVDAAVRRARTHPVAWIVIVASVVVGGGLISLADQTLSNAARNAAETYLPADGSARVVTYNDGAEWIIESALSTGVPFLVQQPPISGEHQLTSLQQSGQNPSTARLWRQTWTDVVGERAQITELYQLSADGVRLLTLSGGENGFSFSPGLLIMPADVSAGSTWQSSGDALPQSFIAYSSTGSARAAADGCLEISLTVTYTDPSQADAVLLDTAEDSVWCPGEGQVSADYSNDGVPGSNDTARFGGRTLQGATTDAPVDYSGFAEWASTEVPLLIRDPVFGESTLTGTTDAMGAVTASGVAVFNTGPDVVAYETVDEAMVRSWIVHPGGNVVRLTAIGDVVLVSTTDRELIAYDSQGRRGWTLEFADVVSATPVSDGSGGALLLSLDGELRRVDLGTGEVAWSRSIGGDSDIPPAVASDRVFTVDRVNGVQAFALESGEPIWSAPIDRPALVAADGERVFVASGSDPLTAWDAATGVELWSNYLPGLAQSLVVLDEVVVGQTSEATFAFSETGVDLWRFEATGGLLTDGRQLVLGGFDTAQLVGPDGVSVTSWPIISETFDSTRTLIPLDEGFVVVNSAFRLGTVTP